jgi:hypothetical protein
MADVRKGVKKARRKFQSQFDAVARDIPFARYSEGNSSAIKVHTIGPQVQANPRRY